MVVHQGGGSREEALYLGFAIIIYIKLGGFNVLCRQWSKVQMIYGFTNIIYHDLCIDIFIQDHYKVVLCSKMVPPSQWLKLMYISDTKNLLQSVLSNSWIIRSFLWVPWQLYQNNVKKIVCNSNLCCLIRTNFEKHL